jgi:chromosome segregation ATPase
MKRTNSNNSGNKYRSYQQGGSQYQPAVHYAADQTTVLEDTTKSYYQADETAAAVLQSMQGQKQQLNSASNNVWDMRQTTEKAKREIESLHKKYREKKQRLYATIALLALTDMLLFFRILQCRGNFFC